MAKDHFYKAGARIARTGGADAKRTMLAWCVKNDLTDWQRQAVLDGFRDEIANGGRSQCLGLAVE